MSSPPSPAPEHKGVVLDELAKLPVDEQRKAVRTKTLPPREPKSPAALARGDDEIDRRKGFGITGYCGATARAQSPSRGERHSLSGGTLPSSCRVKKRGVPVGAPT